ncbi:WSC domain-containing protein [Colletotrichum sidae]|uniref:WSC domain-containing protein n=3 Tax=Colletotrichum orbiculare species complex TaxID=2707354 RepID=A0A484FA50_COLOR|nr:WSC domain-containing protein [Colletotrichum orbiculare MAFF 240422]TDZ30603.1 WSC domain-containing protein [Colletotrichum spinosum]TEA10119.1 WSC domain-containing protein [Colletotrichum sidae]
MHASSYLSVVVLALATLVSAQDTIDDLGGAVIPETNSTQAEKRAEFRPRGSTGQHEVLKRAKDGICDALPSKWAYMGCFSDSPSSRVLSGDSWCVDATGPEGLTQEKCIAFCDQKGYGMAGVEWGKECYCGYVLDNSAKKSAETDCSMTCTGNSDEVCGNGGRINVFTNGDSAPAVLRASGDFSSLGCYSDSASARTLTTRVGLPGNVRVSDCTTACANQGFQYAGLEFGSECYCGTGISNGGAPIADKLCNMACTADKTEYCGGRAAINIYKSSAPQVAQSKIPDGWAMKNCYTDSPSARALSYKVPSFDKFSAAQCVSQCAGLGYLFAGLEYGSECYCGNTIDNGNKPASSGCDMSCAGNRADTCGGAGRVNIYQAPCSGKPGCHFNFGRISIRRGITKKQCADYCHADANCQSFQYGNDNGLFCNLFKYPIPAVRATGYDNNARCNSFSFYDGACIF